MPFAAAAALVIALVGPATALRFGWAVLPFLLPGAVAAYYAAPGNGPVALFLGWALMTASRAVLPGVLSEGWGFLALALGATLVLSLRSPRPLRSLRFCCTGSPPFVISLVTVAACLLTLVLVAVPFLNLGHMTPAGAAFPSYFDYDFLQHRAIAQSLERSVPPANPYLVGETLHYYWLSHLFPAAVVPATGGDPLRAHLACQVVVDLLFVALLVSVLARATGNPRALAWCLGLLFCAYSYKGLLALAAPVIEGLFPGILHVPSASADGLARISPLSHGLFRDLLYEGHALASLGLVLIAVLRPMAAWQAGFLVGLAVGFDAFLGFVGAAALGLELLRRQGSLAERARRVAFMGAGLAVVWAAYTWLRMFNGGPPLVAPFTRIIAVLPLYLVAEYGPLVLLAGLAFYFGPGRALWRTAPGLVVLGVVAIGCGLVLAAPNNPEMFLRKGVKAAQLMLAVAAGLYLTEVVTARRFKAVALAAALIVPAFASLGLDWACHAGLSDRAGVTYVPAADLAACAWVRKHTPADAVFLSLPCRDDYSIVPSLAGRRVAVGNVHHSALFQVDVQAARASFRSAWQAFAAPDAQGLAELARSTGAGHLYCGTYERSRFPDLPARLAAWKELEPIYDADGVTVYRIRNTPSGALSLGGGHD